jgi:hypothetical protein
MELHVPHGSVRSIKDFLIHLGIVTLGIVIALGLGQLVEAYHRSRMAAETLIGFGREITFAASQVNQVVDWMPVWRNEIEVEIAKLSTPRGPGTAEEPIKYPEVAYQLIRSASWDTAVATQVLGAIPPDKVRGYEVAYAELKIFVDEERTGVGYWHDLHAYGENAAVLSIEERRALIRELRRYESFTRFLESFGNEALKTCADALK